MAMKCEIELDCIELQDSLSTRGRESVLDRKC